MRALTEPLSLAFMQRALAEIMVLAVIGALLGTHIVLRRLAFFTHGVGAAGFPGLVVAGPLGIAPQLGALAVAVAFAFGLERATRAARLEYDAATALLLVTALAGGVVLASDVYRTGAGVDQLLFGTLVGLDRTDLALSAGAGCLAVLASSALGATWLATAFDAEGARRLGLPVALGDFALVAAIAVAVVAALEAVGALLVSATLVVPAATARLVARSVRTLQAGAFALAVVEGFAGLLAAYWLDVPPGPAIALLGGSVFALVALAQRARTGIPGPIRPRPASP